MTIDNGERWPEKATMRHAGHKIVELDATVRQLLIERQGLSTAPGLIARLLTLSAGHPGIVQALAALERYAVNERFYNLDLLGRQEQGTMSPQELWDELEMSILDANPEMLEQLAGPEYRVASVGRSRGNGAFSFNSATWRHQQGARTDSRSRCPRDPAKALPSRVPQSQHLVSRTGVLRRAWFHGVDVGSTEYR